MFQLHSTYMKQAILVMATAFAMLFATSAFAEEKLTTDEGVCAYKPSNFIGGFGAGAVSSGTGAAAAAGAGLKGAGFYSMTHAVTGATMLGTTAGGASAAGTAGILGGTAGAIGTTAAFFMSPFVIIGGAVIATGIGGYEAYCYFTEDSDEETPE